MNWKDTYSSIHWNSVMSVDRKPEAGIKVKPLIDDSVSDSTSAFIHCWFIFLLSGCDHFILSHVRTAVLRLVLGPWERLCYCLHRPETCCRLHTFFLLMFLFFFFELIIYGVKS